MRLLLTILVLANSLGSAPTIGHAHGLPRHSHDGHHVNWADHDHSTEQGMLTESDQHPDHPIVGEAVSHLHGVWLGIAFSLPSPTNLASHRIDPHPLADIFSTPGLTATGNHPGTGLQPGVWPPDLLGCCSPPHPLPLVSDHLLRATFPPDGVLSPDALRLRTVLIRC